MIAPVREEESIIANGHYRFVNSPYALRLDPVRNGDGTLAVCRIFKLPVTSRTSVQEANGKNELLPCALHFSSSPVGRIS